MTTPTEEALRVIGLCERATPGEWLSYDDNEGDGHPPRQLWCVRNPDYDSGSDEATPFQATVYYGGKEDSEAIAAAVNFARTHLPDLLAEMERMRLVESQLRDATVLALSQIEALREDAERYRFIAADHSAAWEAELDATIDAARRNDEAAE